MSVLPFYKCNVLSCTSLISKKMISHVNFCQDYKLHLPVWVLKVNLLSLKNLLALNY